MNELNNVLLKLSTALDELDRNMERAKLEMDRTIKLVIANSDPDQRAIRSRELIRGHCYFCGSLETVAHHEDCEKIDVEWLCVKHHADVHAGRVGFDAEHDCKLGSRGEDGCEHWSHKGLPF